jgi:DNA-binding CsgD family transcriptional regulator
MPSPDWPFLGRDEQVLELVDAVAGRRVRRGLLLRGAAGTGKTTLARATTSKLRKRGVDVVECHASVSLATIPFGALAPALARLGVTSATETQPNVGEGRDATFLASVCSALASSTAIGLLVDDVAHADTGSLAVVRAAVLLEDCPVILTARSTDVLPPLLAGLVDEGLIDTVDVVPLDRRASDAVLTHALGGPIDPTTARRMYDTSQGNPLFLRELVRGARASGTLLEGPHGFSTGPVPSTRLIELLGARVRRADEAERRVIELLAAAQPVPVAALGPRAVIDRLESEGVISIDEVAPVLLTRLGHPIYDEIVRASTPTARWHDRLREAALLLRQQAPHDDDARLRAVDLELRSGAEVPEPDLLRASRRAATLLDHELSLDLARHLEAAGAPAAGLQLQGSALSALGRLAEAEDVLRRSLDLATTDEQIARAAQPLAQLLAVRVGQPTEAVAALDGALSRIDDPSWEAFLAADRVRWALLAGQSTTFAGDAAQTGAARLNGLMVESLVNLMDGHLATADRAIEEGLALSNAHRDVVGHATELLTLSRCMHRFFSGDLTGASEFARAELAAAGARNDEPVGMWAYALSAISLQAGRLDDALGWSELAVPRLRWRDFTGLASTAVAVQATALAQQGRSGEARALLGSSPSDGPSDTWATMQSAQAAAWCEVDEGRVAEGAGMVAAAGRAGMDSGHLYLGALACYTAVRFHRPGDVVDHLEHAAALGEGQLLTTLAGHARALVDQQADRLAEVAHDLGAAGLPTAAAAALEQSAALRHRTGDREAARKLRLRAVHLLSGAGLDPAGSASVTPLTHREREIAIMAASRHSSRQIADELGISVRTVDNHLARVYRKLGVLSRRDLPVALDDVGLLASDR